MAEGIVLDVDRFKTENKSAFVVGYTGGTGSCLVNELAKIKIFKRIVLIGRREVSLPIGDEFEQKIVNFDRLEDYKEAFKDIDVGFYLLGTTRGKAGREGFIRVDRDYCLKTAEIAKEQNCKHFLLLSSAMSSSKSSTLYLRIKGEVEDAVKQINFDRLSIFQPSFLIGKRQECRAADVLGICLRPIACCCNTSLSVYMESVARAMVTDAVRPDTEHNRQQVLSNTAIQKLASDYPF